MIPKNCNWPVAVDFRNARSRLCDMVCRAINHTLVVEDCTRRNNTAGRRTCRDLISFPATSCGLEAEVQTVRYFSLQAVCAALRGIRGTAGMTRKRQPGMAREQQAEAAKLNAAIAANLKELGYGG